MNNEYLNKYEETVSLALHSFLLEKGEVDERKPEATDIEEKWEALVHSYLPDGVREFNQYPTVSLGWMMFIGMAVAKFWDTDWGSYNKEKDLYFLMREVRGFDYLDEYICEVILGLNKDEQQQTTKLVGNCAVTMHKALLHEGFEPGTTAAFHAYVRTLHQLYLAGTAVQLKRMGYKMTKMG